MKSASADGGNESGEKSWPRVLQIASSEEFQQSYAVARLAVKLWEASKASKEKLIEKAAPEDFLVDAWELILKAREHVLRAQTDVEYLQSGSVEAAQKVVGRILGCSRVRFALLCDSKRKKGDTETIKLFDAVSGETIEVEWKMYRGEGGERAFDKMFWVWWGETSTLRLRMIVSPGVPGDAPDKWREYGRQMLASWKKDGVPANDFLAFARFRREHDKRRRI